MLENKSIDKQTSEYSDPNPNPNHYIYICLLRTMNKYNYNILTITRVTIYILNTLMLSGYCNYNACASTC